MRTVPTRSRNAKEYVFNDTLDFMEKVQVEVHRSPILARRGKKGLEFKPRRR